MDISNNIALTELYCGGNQLTSLDISNNLTLTSLVCDNNQLTSLDVSNNIALTELYCGGNQLTSLDISNNLTLTSLVCDNNQLTSLDISDNIALTKLYCHDNQLTSLNIANGQNSLYIPHGIHAAPTIFLFYAGDNPKLTCIQVDPSSRVGGGGSSVTYSTSCEPIGIKDPLNKEQFGLYPNPVSETLYFNKKLSNVFIYSAQGKLMGEYMKLESLDVSNYPAGIYLIKSYEMNSQFVIQF